MLLLEKEAEALRTRKIQLNDVPSWNIHKNEQKLKMKRRQMSERRRIRRRRIRKCYDEMD